MNPDQPSREQIETRITALLLGELPADEAALLRYTIAQDPELQQLHDEMQSALVLVREVAKHPADAPAEKSAPLQLSAERRQKLLAHFKTPRAKASLKPLFWLKRIEVSPLIRALVAVAVIAVLAAMLLPTLKNEGKSRGAYGSESLLSGLRGRIWSADNESREEIRVKPVPQPSDQFAPMGKPAPASPPMEVTLSPQPQLAAPPLTLPGTQIVLPQTESTAETAASAEAGKAEVISQHVVGYVNVSPSAGEGLPASPTPPPPVLAPPPAAAAGQFALNDHVDTQDRLERVEKQWAVPGQTRKASGSISGTSAGNNQNRATVGVVNAFAGAGGFRGTGVGGGGGLASTPPITTGGTSRGQAAPDLDGIPIVVTRSVAPTHGSSMTQSSNKRELERPKASGNYNGFFAPSADTEAESPHQVSPSFSLNSRAQTAPLPADSAQTIESPTLALNNYNSAATRSPENYSPNSAKHGFAILGPIGHSTEEALLAPSSGVPASKKPKAKQPEGGLSFISGVRNTGAVGGAGGAGDTSVADNTFYHNPAPEPAEKKVPILDDIPVAGSLFQSSTPARTGLPSPAPAPANAGSPVAVNTFNFDIGGVHAPDSSSSPAAENRNPFVGRYAYLPPGFSGQPQVTNAITSNGGQQNTFNPGVSAILPGNGESETINVNEALDRFAKLNGLTVLHSALPSDGQITIPKSLSGQSESTALQAALALNGVSMVKMGDKFVKAIPGDQAGQAGEAITKQDFQSTEAKHDLEQKIKMHELLYAKLEAEKLDLDLPKNSLVQLTDPAQPGRSQNAWQSLTGQVESKARIKVENDGTDIQGMSGTPNYVAFDPYFIQTTFEIMQSEAVLGKVVDALHLESAWANKSGGKKLERSEAIAELKQRLDFRPVPNTKLIEIGAKSKDPKEAADIANAVAKAYADYRSESRRQLTDTGIRTLELQLARQKEEIQIAQAEVERLGTQSAPEPAAEQTDVPLRKPAPNAPVPQPEILTRENAFSTFSLNVSDVSFKFAEASLQNGKLPDSASIRSEEFINAFDYRDPEAAAGQPLAFASERARYPFAHNRELLRFAVKTAAAGRQPGRALNLVLLLDNSGSMERADRVAIIREALRVLAAQLQPQDTVSVVTFSRTARLWADGVSGDQAGATLDQVGSITPEGGTNLEEAMRLAYETARRHYLANGINRVVLLTDGAANLGNVDPNALKQKVEAQRKQGIALDCFGIGWEDYNDDLLEQLASNGDGRYAFLNSPEDVAKDFAAKLAGALQIAAADVKVQVEFNPQRVTAYRQIGYATHQLTKEQFRDNTVAAGQIAAQESGNALYTIETNPNGDGPVATVHVRYKVPGTNEYREHSWDVAYDGNAPALDQSSSAMRLAATASAFSEWLAASPYAQAVTLDDLLKYLSGVPEIYGADDRPKQLETMIREAKSLEGK